MAYFCLGALAGAKRKQLGEELGPTWDNTKHRARSCGGFVGSFLRQQTKKARKVQRTGRSAWLFCGGYLEGLDRGKDVDDCINRRCDPGCNGNQGKSKGQGRRKKKMEKPGKLAGERGRNGSHRQACTY